MVPDSDSLCWMPCSQGNQFPLGREARNGFKPEDGSLIRLVGAVLAEQRDE